MNDPMERVLFSLEQARRNLDLPESRLDVHSIVHELMHELLREMNGQHKAMGAAAHQPDERTSMVWLHDLIAGLTDTCFMLTESSPDVAANALRTRIDRALDNFRQKPANL